MIEMRALMEGYRLGILRRSEVRVVAARYEAAALHKDSSVSLYRIVNCQSQTKGNRRLSHNEIEAAAACLDALLPELQPTFAHGSDGEQWTTTE